MNLPPGLPPGKVTVHLDVPEQASDWENQPWTDEEINELLSLKPMPMKDFLAWLDANPPTEPWGGLRDDEDAAEYVHRLRRQSAFILDEPEDEE